MIVTIILRVLCIFQDFDIYLHVSVPELPTVQGMKIISMSSDLEELTQSSKQEFAQVNIVANKYFKMNE